jgi:cytochrome P450
MAQAQPPGLDGRVGIVNLLRMYGDPFEKFPRWRNEYGDFVRVETVYGTHYILFHPNHVKQVLVEDFDQYVKGDIQRDVFEPVTGTEGLLLSSGEQWEHQRELIQPSLYRDRVAGYVDTMATYTEDMVGSWTDGDEIAINEEMTDLSLAILGQTLFGEDIRERQGPIRNAGRMITEKYDASSLNYFLPDWLPTATNRQFEAAIDAFDREIERLITTRKRELSRSDADPEGQAHGDLLTQLVMIGRGDDDPRPVLDEEVIRDNMKGFVLGGQGTAALALTYTWYLLAKHPEVAERVYEECQATLGDGQPTIDGLDNLTYLDRVIKEALRLFPPVYSLFREPTTDIQIGDYDVPAGTTVVLPQFAIQRDERWYDDPDMFDPDRWTGMDQDTNGDPDRPDLAYFAFGGGPDYCMGEQFARAELKTVIGTIIRDWDVRPITNDFDRVTSITAQPKEDVLVRVSQRD